jgi:hypothetical protein
MLATNLSFNSSNNIAFRRVFRYLKRDIMIPCPTALRKKLQVLYGETEDKIKKSIPQGVKVSIAADAWTSPNKLAFLGVLGYWINDDWELEEVLLGFEEIHGSHTGENMASIIVEVLKRYGIEGQLLGFTSDSASNNGTLTKALKSELGQMSINWECEHNHICCMAHVMQLILSTFMKELKIKVKDEKMPSEFKEKYIEKVQNMDRGFFKTVEKVSPLNIRRLNIRRRMISEILGGTN